MTTLAKEGAADGTREEVEKVVGAGTVREVIVVGTTGRREPELMGVNSGISDADFAVED